MPGTASEPTDVPFVPPERFNIADYFLDDRVREGRGERTALVMDTGRWTYGEVQVFANRFAHRLRGAGVEPEQRVLLALPDGVELVAALFAVLKAGAVAALVNPGLSAEEIEYFIGYTRATVLVTDRDRVGTFLEARERAARAARDFLKAVLVVGDPAFDEALASAPEEFDSFPTHRDDAAIWLFSGGTTGRPKAAVQTHTSYANASVCYGGHVIGYRPEDVTLSVPKLYFGYAMGANLFFPFAVGATSVLDPERCTAERLFGLIERHRPTVLVNVPTMVNRLVSDPSASTRDLSSLRVSMSAGEALPVELHRRWDEAFGVELLDGLGTAEMWHIFLSNRRGDVRPGTLGKAVPGYEVRVCDEEGRPLPRGETGWLWVRGHSRAIGYWQRMDESRRAFRGEWYASSDMVREDADGYVVYCGRGDDMLKVSGKWLSPKEVEDCLVEHPAVREAVVVGAANAAGLTKPWAFVVPESEGSGAAAGTDAGAGRPSGGDEGDLAEALQVWVRERLAPYKYPRRVVLVADLPRTHLGKVDRGAVRRRARELGRE
ncbi:MAG: benzoate-CoA ligase family protein [Candidatus Palauibacterales bacterium]|nr:benzoate-CoA ligase family protein [Candidatus Palauibacterales bacterium]